MHAARFCAILACFFTAVESVPAKVADPTVTIAAGVVIGTATSVFSAPASTATVLNYLGIPFAAPPTGARRFAPPVNAAAWSSPLQAKTLPPACIQQFVYPKATADFSEAVFGHPFQAPPPESEDCLYLNIYAPISACSTNLKPVMFWIYGGNLQFGTGSLNTYNGSAFAGFRDVVVVTFNYRTNMFGFSGAPENPAGQQNSGFLDQRFALQWVQANIAKFGGDPNKVTIFGESAGGYSVKQLLALPPSPLPFRAAILESQQSGVKGSAQVSYQQVSAHFNCTTAPSPGYCVRAIPATDIKSYISQQSLNFPPTEDSVTFVQNVQPSIITRKFANVPILLGTNKDEFRVFLSAQGFGPNATIALVYGLLSTYFPGDTALQAAILAVYAPLGLTPYELAAAILTDSAFTCTTAELGNLATLNGYKAWRYQYFGDFPNIAFGPDAGAFHTAEIPMVWGTYPIQGATATEEQLSAYMQKVWAQFAKTPEKGAPWPRLGTNGGLELGELGAKANPTGEYTASLLDADAVCALYAPVLALTGP